MTLFFLAAGVKMLTHMPALQRFASINFLCKRQSVKLFNLSCEYIL